MMTTMVAGGEGGGRSRQRRGCELRRRRGGEEGRCDPQQAHGLCFSEPDLFHAGSLLERSCCDGDAFWLARISPYVSDIGDRRLQQHFYQESAE